MKIYKFLKQVYYDENLGTFNFCGKGDGYVKHLIDAGIVKEKKLYYEITAENFEKHIVDINFTLYGDVLLVVHIDKLLPVKFSGDWRRQINWDDLPSVMKAVMKAFDNTVKLLKMYPAYSNHIKIIYRKEF